MKFIFGELGCVTSNSWLDFGADPVHDPDTGIFKGIFTTVGWRQFNQEVVDKFLWIFMRGGMSHYQQTIQF